MSSRAFDGPRLLASLAGTMAETTSARISMVPFLRTLIVILAAVLVFAPASHAQGLDQPVIAFVHASVVTMESESVRRDHTVVVRGERIVAFIPDWQASHGSTRGAV